MRKIVYAFAAAAFVANSAAATAHTAPVPATPVPVGVIVGVKVVEELLKPKPFCKALKLFNRKKRC